MMSKFITRALKALFVLNIILVISAEKPVKKGPCTAQLANGNLIDLSSLDKSSSPRSVTDSRGVYTYSYNPCTPIKCKGGAAPSSAVCQKASTGNNVYDLGAQSSVDFDYSNNILSMAFEALDGVRSSVIKCTCAQSEVFQIEDDTNPFIFTFASKCCCPSPKGCDGGGGGGGSSGGLGIGSILLLIFFPGLAAYFIIGALYLKFVKHNSGAELIPNRGFWTSLPGDVKDGATFVKSKFISKSYSQI